MRAMPWPGAGRARPGRRAHVPVGRSLPLLLVTGDAALAPARYRVSPICQSELTRKGRRIRAHPADGAKAQNAAIFAVGEARTRLSVQTAHQVSGNTI